MMFKKIWKRWICLFLLLMNIIILMLQLLTSVNIDNIVSRYAKTMDYTVLYHFAFNVTKLGSSTFLIPFTIFIAIMLTLLYREYKQAIVISSATVFTYILNELIKIIVKRERPSLFIEAHATGYSFPSGHSMIPFVFYGLLLYYFNRKVKNERIKLVFTMTIVSVILLIGLSRVILNVHYLSDVLTGFLVGFIILETVIYIEAKVK